MAPPPESRDDDDIDLDLDVEGGDATWYEEASDFAPGGQVGRYQLCFELASGGMAKVYLARVTGESGFDKLVALKRIHPHLAEQEEFLEMFMDEARLAARVDHPNVCTVFDFGRAGREHFIAMEFLLGETLARIMRGVPPSMLGTPRWSALAMRMVAEASHGLHAAHELCNDDGEPLDVVHRDVTPANIFLTYDGAVKVVDFGVARAAERVHQTRAGHVKGQYAYIAPEQARGAKIDRRADLWSLGVVLWELLAGRRLFERANEAATLMAVVGGEVPPLREIQPGVPEDVASIVARALSTDPAQRFPTARALARELDLAVARLGDPVGKAELGELMEALFSSELVKRKKMLAEARRIEPGRVLKVEDSHVRAIAAGRPEEERPEEEALASFATFDDGDDPWADQPTRLDATAFPMHALRMEGVTAVEPAPVFHATPLGGEAPTALAAQDAAPTISADDALVAMPEPGVAPIEQVSLLAAEAPPRARGLDPRWVLAGAIGVVVMLLTFIVTVTLTMGGAGETRTSPDSRSASVPDPPAGSAGSRSDPPIEPAVEPAVDTAEVARVEEPTAIEPAIEAPVDVVDEAVVADVEPPEVDDDPATPPTTQRTTPAGRPTRAAPPVRPPARLATGVASARGTVNVVTPGGWAEIYHGDRRVGRSPGRVELPAGLQRLVLRPFGTGAEHAVMVDVPADGTARVSVPVTP